MLPILIIPDSASEPEDVVPLEATDAEIGPGATHDFWELWPPAGLRPRGASGAWVELRHPVPPVTQATDAAPASLRDCDQLLKLLLRRRAESLGRHERAELRRVWNATGPASSSIAMLSPDTAAWLLWAMNWRGVSTIRQLASPPLHAPTLVVQWWTGMPASLSFGPAAALLRVFADCAERLYRFWRRMVTHRRERGGAALDPRMVKIKFTPLMPETNCACAIDSSGGKPSFASLVCANLPTSDSFAA